MTPVVETTPKAQLPWTKLAWFGALLVAAYAPVLWRLVRQWNNDADMGHGFFVPLIAGFIVWQRRDELASLQPAPNLWGLAVVVYGGVQLYLATLGAELFLARTAFVISLFGAVLLLGGKPFVRALAFPLFLLVFMVPIPAVIYNRITFPLQLLASHLADDALTLLQIPVLREGNILELPMQRLSVVEACSGIRSLLSLTFLALVYGYFFEKRTWVRVVLFVATIPIAIVANGSRVTLTGVLTQVKPELAEGFFHSASGWVIFMLALFILIGFHLLIVRVSGFLGDQEVEGMSFLRSKYALILTVVLLLQCGAYYAAELRPENVPVVRPLSAFPADLQGWKVVQDSPVEQEVLDVLKADDTLSRVYLNSAGKVGASLFIAFFKTQRSGQAPHSPKNCLPGSGWEPSETALQTVDLPGASTPRITVNRWVVSRGEEKSVVLYWYQSHNRVIAGEFSAKFWLVADSIRYHRSDTALVRLVVPVRGGREDEAVQSGVAFIQALFPELEKQLPS